MYSFRSIQKQHLQLRLREHCCRGGSSILKPEDQGVCCETVFPSDVANMNAEAWADENNTHTKWPLLIAPPTESSGAPQIYLLTTPPFTSIRPPNMEPYRLDSLPSPLFPAHWVLGGTQLPEHSDILPGPSFFLHFSTHLHQTCWSKTIQPKDNHQWPDTPRSSRLGCLPIPTTTGKTRD